MATIMIVDHDSITDSLREQGVPANPAQIARWLRGAAELFDPQAEIVAYGTWFRYPEEATADGDVIPSSSAAFASEGFRMQHADSPDELDERLDTRINELYNSSYNQVIIVSNNRSIARQADTLHRTQQGMIIRLWGTSAMPAQLRKDYLNFIDIQERLDLKVKKGVLIVDLENVFISLRKNGYGIPTKALIEILNEFADRQAQIVERLAFADFGALARVHGPEVFEMQRQLEVNHITTRYVVSTAGKSTSDMRIVNELNTLVKKNGFDVVVLVSSDQDFRPSIEALQRQRCKVVVLAMQGATSLALRNMEGVRVEMLESHLPEEFKRKAAPETAAHGQQLSAQARLAVILNEKMRSQNWQWITRENAIRALIEDGGLGGRPDIERLVKESADEGLLSPVQGQTGTAFRLELKHETVQAALAIIDVLCQRMQYTHKVKQYPSIREGYIIRGLNDDERLKKHEITLSPAAGRAWLDFAVARGILTMELVEDSQKPGMMVNMYKLNEWPGAKVLNFGTDDVDTMCRRLVTSYDQYNAINGNGWVSLKALDSHLTDYGRPAFFRAVDMLLNAGAATKNQYPNKRPGAMPVSGLELNPNAEMIRAIRQERHAVLAGTWRLHKQEQAINAGSLLTQPELMGFDEAKCRAWLDILNGERVLANVGGTQASYRLNAVHPLVRMEMLDAPQAAAVVEPLSAKPNTSADGAYRLHPAA